MQIRQRIDDLNVVAASQRSHRVRGNTQPTRAELDGDVFMLYICLPPLSAFVIMEPVSVSGVRLVKTL
jgi:hypothetical protein